MFSNGTLVILPVLPLEPIAKCPGARRPLARPALALLLLLCASCWLNKKKSTPQTAVLIPQTEFVIRVTNHNYLDVVVYAVVHGVRTRVGTVTGSTVEVFLVSSRLLSQGGEIQLLGDAIGNDDYALTERLIVQPGQYIDWTLESDLRRSTVAVY